MRQLFENQHAVTALAQNIEYTSTSSGTFLRSGCQVTPNTTQTGTIVVDVESGSIALASADNPIGINSQSVELSPVPSNSDPDLTNARVDVINLTKNGASKVEGNVAVKRPTTADPYNDAVEGQWPSLIAPRPDDGGLVDGVARAVVFLDESVSDSTDITAAMIRNYDAFGQAAITEATLQTAVENLNDPVAIEAQSAATFGGSYPNEYRRDPFSVAVPSPAEKIPGGEKRRAFIALPPDHPFRLRRVSIMDVGQTVAPDVHATVTVRKGFGAVTVYDSTNEFEENNDGSPIATSNGPTSGFASVELAVENQGSQQTDNALNAVFTGDIADNSFAP